MFFIIFISYLKLHENVIVYCNLQHNCHATKFWSCDRLNWGLALLFSVCDVVELCVFTLCYIKNWRNVTAFIR